MSRSRLKDSPLAGAIGSALARPGRRVSGRTSLMVDREVAERVRDAAFWERTAVKALVEEALLEKVERMEEARGEIYSPWPKR